jgi:hypothetical protein
MDKEEFEQKLEQENISEEEKQKLLDMSEISLILDTYDDIFSDFDPRPYAKRSLSVDFLDEAKRASRDKGNEIEIKFIIPQKLRNLPLEKTIKRRLKEHFIRHYRLVLGDKNKLIREGFLLTVLGVVLMFATTYILYANLEKSIYMRFVTVLLEPGGWFMFWEGLSQMVFTSRTKNSDLGFYEKMTKCNIQFIPY